MKRAQDLTAAVYSMGGFATILAMSAMNFMSTPVRRMRAAAACLVLASAPLQAAQAPPTFSTVIGHALLCLNQMDAGYFHAYLTKAFGPAYKHEAGAWWFRAGTTLWNVPVSEVMVSDGDSSQTFIGAIVDVPPEQLETAITTAMGIRHKKTDASQYPLRESPAGSVIAYAAQKSKIYCAKSQMLVPVLRP